MARVERKLAGQIAKGDIFWNGNNWSEVLEILEADETFVRIRRQVLGASLVFETGYNALRTFQVRL